MMEYSYDRRAAQSLRIDSSTRRRTNADLNRKGFDGNSRFRTISQALNVAVGVLDANGMEPAEVLSAWTYKQPKGHHGITLAFKNPDDPFSPVDISNAVLAFSWTELETGFEVIAYVS